MCVCVCVCVCVIVAGFNVSWPWLSPLFGSSGSSVVGVVGNGVT